MTAAGAAGAFARATGLHVELVGALTGGEIGASEVRCGSPSRRGVLKWFQDEHEDVRLSIDLAARMRWEGEPVPDHRACVVDGVLIVVQTWMPGAARDVVDGPLADDAIRLVRAREAVRVDGRAQEPWGAQVVRIMRERATATRTELPADLELDAAAFPTGAVVHADFHHRNLLTVDGRLSAVVDWDSARVGDPVFDLVTLAFCAVVAHADPGAVDRLWAAALQARGAAVVRTYAASVGLRQIEWSLRHRTPADADRWRDATAVALRRP